MERKGDQIIPAILSAGVDIVRDSASTGFNKGVEGAVKIAAGPYGDTRPLVEHPVIRLAQTVQEVLGQENKVQTAGTVASGILRNIFGRE
jgi:hypothetical protein